MPLLTGSESGFSLTPYGDWHYRELEVFVDYLGLTPLQAIQCATGHGASALRMEGEIGCVKAGYLADLLVVEGDPLEQLSLLGDSSRFRHIFKGGREIDRSRPLPDSWNLPGWRVAEFSSRVLSRELVESMGGESV